MAGHKKADLNWDATNEKGLCETWDQVHAVLLMDIRHELQRLNNVFNCTNFLAVPHKLDEIITNTKKKTRRRRAAVRR